jgi:hypothetical protein
MVCASLTPPPSPRRSRSVAAAPRWSNPCTQRERSRLESQLGASRERFSLLLGFSFGVRGAAGEPGGDSRRRAGCGSEGLRGCELGVVGFRRIFEMAEGGPLGLLVFATILALIGVLAFSIRLFSVSSGSAVCVSINLGEFGFTDSAVVCIVNGSSL